MLMGSYEKQICSSNFTTARREGLSRHAALRIPTPRLPDRDDDARVI